MLGVVVDLAGAPLMRRQRQLPAGGPKKGGAALLKLIGELRAVAEERQATSRLLGLGIAMPGPFGVMDNEDPWGMQDWQDFPLADWLAGKTGLEVSVQNDAAAGAIAEKMYGAAAGLENFVHLFIGYGLGAGLVLRGEVYSGAANNAGEIGQVVSAAARTGNPEAIEHYASLLALCRHLGVDPRRAGLLDHLQGLFEADDKRIRPGSRRRSVTCAMPCRRWNRCSTRRPSSSAARCRRACSPRWWRRWSRCSHRLRIAASGSGRASPSAPQDYGRPRWAPPCNPSRAHLIRNSRRF